MNQRLLIGEAVVNSMRSDEIFISTRLSLSEFHEMDKGVKHKEAST